jgi:hypothetical protein
MRIDASASRAGAAPVRTVAVSIVLWLVTSAVLLVFTGRLPLAPVTPAESGTIFYVVPYHYGFAFYDQGFVERTTLEVRTGDTVTLVIVPAQALPRETFLAYNERTRGRAVGGLPAGDPRVQTKIAEDLALGNVEHIVGIAGHSVYATTRVATALAGKRFREDGPRTLEDAVRARDPAITSVTFTARRPGAYDVICIDSGMDGSGTCGWGHKWMVSRSALVVRP